MHSRAEALKKDPSSGENQK
jgi:hypothetical protein